MAKMRSVLCDDGYYWLVFEYLGGKRIYLHRQAKVGERFRPGQRAQEDS